MTKVIATVVNAAGKTVNATMSVCPETVYTSDNITTVPAPVRGDADDKGRIEVEVDASHGGRWAIVLNVAPLIPAILVAAARAMLARSPSVTMVLPGPTESEKT